MDSHLVVKSLHEADPGFRDLVDALFGGTVDADAAWTALYGQVGKSMPDVPDVSSKGRPRKLRVVPKPGSASRPAAAVSETVVAPDDVVKSEDGFPVVWAGEFSKMDTDRRQAFGWASVVQVNGEPVIDLQGDWITPDEIEKAAYSYVKKSRVGGTQHQRTPEGEPVKAGEMIESFVVTPEKIEKMGLPQDFPVGWWVGFQYDDDATWQDIKSGRKTGFSVHGRGKRVPVEI